VKENLSIAKGRSIKIIESKTYVKGLIGSFGLPLSIKLEKIRNKNYGKII